jgi:branched-subunit amino acid transport protein
VTNLVIVLSIGIGTYLARLSSIGLFGARRLPPALERALEYVAPAALAALVLPAVIRPEGVVDITPENLRLFAGVVAALVAWRTRNVLLTTAAGMGALWVLEAVV